MITVITQFQLPAPLAREAAKQIFMSTAPKYRDYPGLIRKYYHLSKDGRMAGAVYLWKSLAEAEKLYTEEWKRVVTEKYRSAPSLVFYDCSVVVDNITREIVDD